MDKSIPLKNTIAFKSDNCLTIKLVKVGFRNC